MPSSLTESQHKLSFSLTEILENCLPDLEVDAFNQSASVVLTLFLFFYSTGEIGGQVGLCICVSASLLTLIEFLVGMRLGFTDWK